MNYLGINNGYTNISFGAIPVTTQGNTPPLPKKTTEEAKKEEDVKKSVKQLSKIRELIKKFDMYYIGADHNIKNNGYWFWYNTRQGLDVTPNLEEAHIGSFSGLIRNFPHEFEGVNELEVLKELVTQKKKYNKRVFTNDPTGDTVYNYVDTVCKNMMQFNPDSEGVKSDVLDTLFLSVAGGCEISKKILEKSLVSLIHNTRNKNWKITALPPTVLCYGNGGTGKSLLFNSIMPRIFDRKNTFILNSDLAKSKFTNYILGKRLIIYNEITMTLSERIAFTNKIKSYLEEMISIEGKGIDPETIPFIAWMAILSNGQDGAIDLRASAGVSRRFQVMEGKKCLGEMLVDAGLYTLSDDDKKALAKCTKEDQRVIVFDGITRVHFGGIFDDDEVIKGHIEYLFRKYYKELKETNFIVTPIHTSAYDKLLTNQQGQYQENFIDWVFNVMTPDRDYKIKELYDMLDDWAGKSQNRPYKLEDFETSIITLLNSRPELRFVEFCKAKGSSKISLKLNKKVVSMTGVFIRKANYALMKDAISDGSIKTMQITKDEKCEMFDETSGDDEIVVETSPSIVGDCDDLISGLNAVKRNSIGDNFIH